MKKIFTLLLALVTSAGTMFAEKVQIGDLYYNLDATNETAEVTYKSYNNYNYKYNEGWGITTANIPSSVEYNSVTYSVTSIGGYAFFGCTGLTRVTIPNSVTSIGDYAFYGCSSLTSITIPNSVTSIGDHAFGNCSGLTSVSIGNSITSIGECAFVGCSGLTSITIPNSVTGIGGYAFAYCYGLTSITIPNSVTSIEYSAFVGCTGLKAVYVPCGETDRFKYMLSQAGVSTSVPYNPLPFSLTIIPSENGQVTYPKTVCDDSILTATPNYGYHFVQWSDGNTDNPRTIILTQDTTFTAEFAKNEYTITTSSANPEWGKTDGIISALYLDEVTLTATPNYGYHFVQWSDGNTDNPRTITVTGNKTYQAIFAKNIYSITDNSNKEQGNISGVSQAEYLDFVTLTAVPNYGYHFTQWSDGLKDNPRIAQITQDTTFTAEFAYDRVGTCGKDLALVWSYDPVKKVLTIGNAGSFDENMRYGVEAPNEMTELVIGNNVTAIGTSAFANLPTLTKVTIGEAVKTIGDQAFYNCVNLETIFNYRKTPNNAYSTAFDGVDKFECKLYVLAGSIDLYKNAAVWRDFYYNTYPIGAEEKTIIADTVIIEPGDNTAMITWPINDSATTYTIQITKDGEVFCTFIFNMNGQLVGIAFAPSRNGAPQAHAAVMTANGMQFTVTGLNSVTNYGFTLTAKDSQDAVLATYEGEFTTTSNGDYIPESLENVDSSSAPQKVMVNGRIFILRGDKTYTLTGAEVK